MNKLILIGVMMISLFAFAEHSGEETAPPRPKAPWVPLQPYLEDPSAHLITATTEGTYWPAPGYDWDEVNKPPKPVNIKVHWVPGWKSQLFPHITGGEKEGELLLDSGYMWTGKGFNIEWVAGIPHPKYPHVFSTETELYWRPEPGYDFVDATKDFKVYWKPKMKYGGTVQGVMSSDEEGFFVPEFNHKWANGGEEKRPDPNKELRRRLVHEVEEYNTVTRNRFAGGVDGAAAAVTLFMGIRDLTSQLGNDVDRAMPTIEKAVRDFKGQFSTTKSTSDHGSGRDRAGGGRKELASPGGHSVPQ